MVKYDELMLGQQLKTSEETMTQFSNLIYELMMGQKLKPQMKL